MSDARPLSRDAVERLAGRLRDEALRLARALLPGGTSRGDLYRAAKRSQGGPGDSLTVFVSGSKKGKWVHYGGDLDGLTHGDMLDLIIATQRLDKHEAQQWALRWLGLAPGAVEFRRTPEEEAAARKAAAESYRAKLEATARARKNAKALWLACKPLSLDNPAGQYLAGRIPGFATLLDLGWGLSALRYHPALKHPYDARERGWPAMLALCQFGDGKIATVHRYYLVKAGARWDVLREGRDGLDGKLAWCAIEGGFCAVWRGSRTDEGTGEVREGWPWRDPRAGTVRHGEVIVCEGVEDALSLALVQPDRRYAAALSVPNFMQIKLPEWARKVVWFADDDGDNKQTPPLIERALTRLEEQDREVSIARPPKGFKDANAALRGVAA
ncbi:DUF7146 domain-containing protein [Reyranella sp.]|uniref:DUF7146 domain-containing protein n=1 Tax=Reyranella sp. TaxID=1929291 RepID=UPI003D0E8A36